MKKVGRVGIFLYLLPASCVLGLVYFYPLSSLIYYSFMTHGAWKPGFVGWRNFRLILTDRVFYSALYNNGLLLLSVIVLVLFSVIVSVLLFEGVRGRKLYQIFVFVPYTIGVPIAGLILVIILQKEGLLNTLLRYARLSFLAVDWLGNPDIALVTVGGIIVWKTMGFGIMLCFARLMGIDPSLFDAAIIDGTSWWQRLWFVTIPELGRVLRFYFVVSIIDVLSWSFAYVYTTTRGGPVNATNIVPLYIWRVTFYNYQVGQGCATAVILLAIVIVVISLLQRQISLAPLTKEARK